MLDYRDLVVLLARRDIAVRYRQTALGVAWALLQPLGMMLVFAAVLGRIARMPSDGVPYPLFVLTGLLPWLFFASAMNASGTSIIGNPNLVTKVYFPRLVIPLATLGAPAVDFLVGGGLVALVMAWYGITPGPGLLLLPLHFLIAAIMALGTGSLVAALTVSYRDFKHLLPFVTVVWLWLTPVLYPLSAVPASWRWLLLANPMTGAVHGVRAAWLGLPVDWAITSSSAVTSLLVLWGGARYFRSVERRFADIV